MVRQTEYRRNYDAWVGDRLLGIFFAVATGKLTEQSRDGTLNNAGKLRDTLYDLLSLVPTIPNEQKVQRQKEAQQGQEQYVNLLDKEGGYRDISELMGAIKGLNTAIDELRQENHADTATD